MNIELTETQVEKIALDWIRAQQQDTAGARKAIRSLLAGAHFAVWSWDDMLQYAVTLCAKEYFIKSKDILKGLK